MSDQSHRLPGGVMEAFPKLSGDNFWLARSSYCPDPTEFNMHGSPLFREPQHLYAACCEYFQYVQDHPLQRSKATSSEGGNVRLFAIETPRPMTLSGLCNFLGITISKWKKYSADNHLKNVVEFAEQVIYQQKYEGAMNGEFNSAIVIRDLGLADKQEVGGIKDAPPVAFTIEPIKSGTFLPDESGKAGSLDIEEDQPEE